MNDKIRVLGAAEHNLKTIDVELPRNGLTVITGVSGSGKSSLAFDTLFAEGQRRYMESLSAYARQFLDQLGKPQVRRIDGLSPSIAIEQRSANMNPRSIVATVTEIHDYLRLLYANAGEPHCPHCHAPLARMSAEDVATELSQADAGSKLVLLAPRVAGEKGTHREELRRIQRRGYVRARIDGVMVELEQCPTLTASQEHNIDVVIDRLSLNPTKGVSRLTDSIELALREGNGRIFALLQSPGQTDWAEKQYSEDFRCDACNVAFMPLTARHFSFNSPQGACPRCDGLGTEMVFDEALVAPDAVCPLNKGAIQPWRTGGRALVSFYRNQIKGFAAHVGVDPSIPIGDLNASAREILFHGSGKEEIEYYVRHRGVPRRKKNVFEGVLPNLMRRLRETSSESVRQRLRRYMKRQRCPACKGQRLRPESIACTFRDVSLPDMLSWSIQRTLAFFEDLSFSDREKLIIGELLQEITRRLFFLSDAGLSYLSLDRESATLSGGEAQRLRLATQMGSALTGVLYVLDEPTIGLHERDNVRLIAILQRLRDVGNTVVVVEHDESMIRAADWAIDLGPGAGTEGGNVMFCGPVEELMACQRSPTARFLRHDETRVESFTRKSANEMFLTIKGATAHNLKNIDVRIPLGCVVCVTGVSGSGKSSLVDEVLRKGACKVLNRSQETPGAYRCIRGLEQIDKVIVIDQSPIGRTPRSNPATYTGAFDPIRALFAATPSARMRGYGPGRFSFNVKGGRCEACRGDGQIKLEMHFLPDVYVVCERCQGLRYNRETLEVTYHGCSIADVLGMTVDQALDVFANVPAVARRLQALADTGLGYVKLGQSATTLSGGEAQRVKLSAELGRRASGNVLYLLDEPTTGLHFHDVKQLLTVLFRLRDQGHSVVMIEHNLDVIRSSDYVIDLGPEGGDDGGYVVAAGTPEEVAANPQSYTGHYLKRRMT